MVEQNNELLMKIMGHAQVVLVHSLKRMRQDMITKIEDMDMDEVVVEEIIAFASRKQLDLMKDKKREIKKIVKWIKLNIHAIVVEENPIGHETAEHQSIGCF